MGISILCYRNRTVLIQPFSYNFILIIVVVIIYIYYLHCGLGRHLLSQNICGWQGADIEVYLLDNAELTH